MSRILPILFNSEMVRAILDGRKTVTRRICKDANEFTVPDMGFYDDRKRTYAIHNYANKEHTDKLSIVERTCPICHDDILYVRETWARAYYICGLSGITCGECHLHQPCYLYKATPDECFVDEDTKWRPSIHMPKEAARIWLRVTDVRVERLQDITEEQAKSEGISEEWAMSWWKPTYSDPDSGGYPRYRDTFAFDLWNSTIKKSDLDRYGWVANPWVWVIEFERCEKPE